MIRNRSEELTGELRYRSDPPPVVRLLVLATFVVILNEAIMVNAIPRLMESMHVTEQSGQWVSTACMLTMAAVISVTGWFPKRVMTRRAYAVAMGTFLTGTLVSAVAPTFAVLLAGWIVQAAGTAVMMPPLMAVVPAQHRGNLMGHVTLAMSTGPALGPTVSGLILQVGSWRAAVRGGTAARGRGDRARAAQAGGHRRAAGQLHRLGQRRRNDARLRRSGLRPEPDRRE
ncbi:MFS transporter [Streptomyces sp. NBC_01808]|uniref:MFS transporter n=1 Tax=Streptomyces sp. NBC_01808 TaxID=2975947 RepID=UPI002DD8AABB|nr:MFS transporter [Streptomyces sp. NBC_01808]WSA40302.1 MFS transporter [Streptomyces sp. NBC_01808]